MNASIRDRAGKVRRAGLSSARILLPVRPSAKRAVDARIRTVLAALDAGADTADSAALRPALDDVLADGDPRRVWLTLAVVNAALPDTPTVRRISRAIRLDGARSALDKHVFAPLFAHVERTHWREVYVVTDRVVVDMDNTSQNIILTGIQRVAHETTSRWVRDHRPIVVAWHPRSPAFRVVQDGSVGMDDASFADAPIDPEAVLVPWRCTYLLPELVAEPRRVTFINALMRFSDNVTGVIGFDCVPITTAETIASDMVGNGFAANLAAVAHADCIGTISEAAATEYNGWKAMLAGAGTPGPKISAVLLPAESREPTTEAVADARRKFILGATPMVLAVGSHEPRKNHDGVLHAAEILWREGLTFSLVFIGGNAWNSSRFENRLAALAAAGRPVQMHSAVSDVELWAAYRLARCTIFPSINEGFGLPAAESLAAGTPVITSNFGSMKEIASGGGALLVDPRDDHDIADALRALLVDDDLHARLSAAARAREPRTWDDYARELWDLFVPPTGEPR
jgi:glycosyltransferase involved in cell wall biosynthesis